MRLRWRAQRRYRAWNCPSRIRNRHGRKHRVPAPKEIKQISKPADPRMLTGSSTYFRLRLQVEESFTNPSHHADNCNPDYVI